jgi:phosphotransferase system IIB component
LQVVIGTNADQVAGEIKSALRSAQPLGTALNTSLGALTTLASLAPASVLSAPFAQQKGMASDTPLPANDASHEPDSSRSAGSFDTLSTAQGAVTEPDEATIRCLLAALGGSANVLTVDVAASRLRIGVMKASAVDAAAIQSLGLRGVALASPECVHVIVGPAADGASDSLRRLLA